MVTGRRSQVEDASALFELDGKSSIPIWLQLKKRFIYLITSGYYMPGDQLPTVRGLAADIEINYNTVSKVYQSLEEDGYIESKRRQGAFVLDVSDRADVSIDATIEIVTVEYIKRCLDLGMGIEDIERQFAVSIGNEKAKRDKSQGGTHAQAQAAGGGTTAGRVVPFPGTSDPSRRSAGNGA